MMKEFLGSSSNLLSINMRDNPISKNKQYKIAVFESCPEISQIDEAMISPNIREGFKVGMM